MIQERLLALQDKKYKEFHQKLMPTVDPDQVIGVRTPALRKLGKELLQEAKTDTTVAKEIEEFLQTLPHTYYEENNLHGLFIERKKDFVESVELLQKFLPYINNWATCDMLRMKNFKKHPEEVLELIKDWLQSKETYTVRFGIGMLMAHYLDANFQPEYLTWVSSIQSEEYYINMMIAWYLATALAKQYDATIPILEEQRMSKWNHNKTIQKAIESYRITPEQKVYLRTLRRK